MSDRIGVMSAGEGPQPGPPRGIHKHPRNRFTANFIGDTRLLNVYLSSVTGARAVVRIWG